MAPRQVTHETVTGWLVPSLLVLLVSVLSWMSVTLYDISKTLAVAVSRVDELDRRITVLEQKP